MMFETNPTPLVEVPALARLANVGRVFLKDEGKRALGNFKSLGGMYATSRVVARHGGIPRVVCASDGNHGLAVAAAARQAGVEARIYLPLGAAPERAARIERQGGQIVWIDGTYDDAVDAARAAAERGDGILVPDTTTQLSDPVVDDVMTGYGRICAELLDQLPEQPTHLFVQAGVGGLAAAIADGIGTYMAQPAKIVVVEPEAAACVKAALEAGHPVQIAGNLETCAEMLSCGLASAPALRTLRRWGAVSLPVTEEQLLGAVERLSALAGTPSTPSGAAGLAGLLAAARDKDIRAALGMGESSRVLLIATEAAL
jgi:diaminopropionate ammonia-lyase